MRFRIMIDNGQEFQKLWKDRLSDFHPKVGDGGYMYIKLADWSDFEKLERLMGSEAIIYTKDVLRCSYKFLDYPLIEFRTMDYEDYPDYEGEWQ